MTARQTLAVAGAALAVLTGGVAYAATSADPVRATCTPNPMVSGKTVVSFDVHCSVPLPPPVTVTVDSSPSTTSPVTSSTSPTSTTASPTSTATAPPSTTSTAPVQGRPTEGDVGTTGTLTKKPGGTLAAGTYTDTEFTGEVKIYDPGVTLRNVKAPSITFYGPGGYTLDRVEAGGIYVDAYYNAIDGVTMTGVRVKATDGDGIDIFSNHKISNVVIDGLIADGFTFPTGSGDHGDGIQVRGVTNLTLRNAIIDMGPWQPQKNAALYLEDVGGINNVLVQDVTLAGGGYTFYSASANASTLRNVDIPRAGNWGAVAITGDGTGWTFTNVTGPNGQPLTP